MPRWYKYFASISLTLGAVWSFAGSFPTTTVQNPFTKTRDYVLDGAAVFSAISAKSGTFLNLSSYARLNEPANFRGITVPDYSSIVVGGGAGFSGTTISNAGIDAGFFYGTKFGLDENNFIYGSELANVAGHIFNLGNPHLTTAEQVFSNHTGVRYPVFNADNSYSWRRPLENVITSGLSYHDFLVYNSTAGAWVNKPASAIPEIVTSAKFTNLSSQTQGHIRSVVPFGGHPAAGSNRQIQYNNVGTPAGAAQLNYSSSKVGIGTSSPQAPLQVHLPTALGSTTNPGTSLYSVSTGLTVSAQDNSAAADLTVADGTTTAGFRGIIRGVRSRGTLVSPSVPILDDQVLSLLGGVWTGSTVWNAADIVFKVDGTVAHNTGGATVDSPIRITFSTRPKGFTWYERLTIKSDGKIGVSTSAPDAKFTIKGDGTTTGANLNLKDSADSLKMTVQDSGLVVYTNGGGTPYGQMYSNTSTTIPVASAGVWYEVDTGATDFTAGRLKNVTHTDHYLTAPTAGDYKIDAAIAFGTSAAGDEVAVSVMVNGTASATCHGHATVVTATTTVPSSCVTILTLAANDQVSLAIQNHSAARNVTISHSQLTILHVGAP